MDNPVFIDDFPNYKPLFISIYSGFLSLPHLRLSNFAPSTARCWLKREAMGHPMTRGRPHFISPLFGMVTIAVELHGITILLCVYIYKYIAYITLVDLPYIYIYMYLYVHQVLEGLGLY